MVKGEVSNAMNRNAIVSNGTVFGLWPLGRSLAVVGVFLVAIFVIMEPEASLGLGLGHGHGSSLSYQASTKYTNE